MLKEFNVKSENQLCFLVKEGEVNDIVLPIKYLQPVDYRRITKMEEVGGELMKVMRDTTLENGVNALIQFQHLLTPVLKPVVEKVAEKKKDTPKGGKATDQAETATRGTFFDQKEEIPQTGRNVE